MVTDTQVGDFDRFPAMALPLRQHATLTEITMIILHSSYIDSRIRDKGWTPSAAAGPQISLSTHPDRTLFIANSCHSFTRTCLRTTTPCPTLAAASFQFYYLHIRKHDELAEKRTKSIKAFN
jgi:hypothetical protein